MTKTVNKCYNSSAQHTHVRRAESDARLCKPFSCQHSIELISQLFTSALFGKEQWSVRIFQTTHVQCSLNDVAEFVFVDEKVTIQITCQIQLSRALQPAVLHPIAEIDENANDKPYYQAKPVSGTECVDQPCAYDDPEDWNYWHPWCTKWPVDIRISSSQNNYSKAHQHKRKERSDHRHIGYDGSWNKRSNDAHENEKEHI